MPPMTMICQELTVAAGRRRRQLFLFSLLWLFAFTPPAAGLSEIHSSGGPPRGVYLCFACNGSDHASAVPPPGYALRFGREMLASAILRRTGLSGPAPFGAPASLDAISSIPGNEYELAAVLESVSPLGGGFALARVARDSLWRFDAGSVVHLVTDPSGGDYVLFTATYSQLVSVDPSLLGAYSFLALPASWTYSSQRLEQDFFLESTASVDVLFSPGGTLWQRAELVPEPRTALASAVCVVLIAAIRRSQGTRSRSPGWG